MIDYTFPMLVGEEEVVHERQLTSEVEAGKMMESTDSVRFIVGHRNLPGATPKECPCFDATTEYASL